MSHNAVKLLLSEQIYDIKKVTHMRCRWYEGTCWLYWYIGIIVIW